MQRSLLALAILTAGSVSATPFVGNDTRSSAMGNTGVASAESFAASNFNPALLSAYDDGVDFGLQLPSLKAAIDDGYGFLESVTVVEDFDNVDSESILLEVNGGGDVKSLTQAINDVQNAADFSDGATQQELDDFETANNALDEKITTIKTEMDNLDVAVTNTNDTLESLEDKPLSFLGSLGTAIAIPRSGLGLALHLKTEANAGMRASISQSDLDKISNIATDTSGFTDEAQQLTTLNSNLASAASTYNNFDTSANPCASDADSDYQTAFNNLAKAQAKLEAESTGTNQNATICDGSGGTTTSVQTPEGSTNVSSYDSANGVYVDGELQASATEGLGDDSTITVLGANVIELGVSASREFTYRGQTFSAGVTPKLLSLQIFEDTIAFDEAGSFDTSSLNQNLTTAFAANIDLGIAKNWYNVLGGQVRAGMAVKDLIPLTFESSSGRELEMGPKVRIGAAHDTRFSTVALDVDLTENEPLGYGVPTRYIGLGGEFDAFNWVKLRAGYRNNLAVDDSHVVTTGLGFTPFGVGLDFSAWLSPASEVEEMLADAGIAAQFSMNW